MTLSTPSTAYASAKLQGTGVGRGLALGPVVPRGALKPLLARLPGRLRDRRQQGAADATAAGVG